MAIISISGKKNSGKDTVASMLQYLLDKESYGYTHPHTLEDYTSYLDNEHPLKSDWKIKKFADPLKDMVCILLNCTREQLEDRDFKESPLPDIWWYYKLERDGGYKNELFPYLEGYPKNVEGAELVKTTPRLLMQQLGTEAGREIMHPDIWVNSLMSIYPPDEVINQLNSTTDGSYGVKQPNWIITDMRFPNEAKAIKDKGGVNIRINRITGNILIDNDTHAVTDHQHISETSLDNYKDWTYVLENKGDLEDLLEEVIKLKEHLQKHGHLT